MITRLRRGLEAAPSLRAGGPRLLCIDDDHDDMVLLRDQLARTGRAYDLVWSHSYEDGLEQLRRGSFAVALVDHRLGARTGLDLIRQATAEGCRIPMVMLTSDRDPWVDHSASELGAVDFLVKGQTTPSELERTLRYAVAQGQAIEVVLQSRERIAVLEEIGHGLGQAGPGTETLQAIVEMIESRLGRSHVSIYLAEGDLFRLGASVGYQAAMPVIYPSGQVQAVLRTRRAAFVANQAASESSRVASIGTELCIPLLEGKTTVGLLLIGSPESNHIGEYEHSFFVAVADRIGAALTLSQDRLDLGVRRRQIRDLSVFAARLAAIEDETALRSGLAAAAAAVVGADRVRIVVRGDERSAWSVVSSHGHPDLVVGQPLTPDLHEARALAGSNAHRAGATSRDQADSKVIAMPIVSGHIVPGLMRLERMSDPFDHFEREAAVLMAANVALVLRARASGVLDRPG